ncbi:WG repeat-containing protein [Bizionia saleffrena]|uniref:WG repeat-containing protein n=1 Tax=Bizionia saleffrena TaxID=291189 RepID=A0A8H2LBP0_9FLAO|nr:WG repeat-containing protein [Bizionia saleffrena]TYB72654.1 WG repeat-containing protein [Bizionia saleffrena]
MKKRIAGIVIICLMVACTSNKDYYLVKFSLSNSDKTGASSGYMNSKGDLIIPVGKYDYCFTDTIRDLGMVVEKETGRILGIDRNANEIFEVFKYDNGPDFVESGLFRILKNGKIGYANTKGEVIIEPQFECAYPFEGHFAKVSNTCKTVNDGEYTAWESEHWYRISRDGKRVKN